MKTIRMSVAKVVAVIALVVSSNVVLAAPLTCQPYRFFGYARINNEPAPRGTVVELYINSVLDDATLTEDESGYFQFWREVCLMDRFTIATAIDGTMTEEVGFEAPLEWAKEPRNYFRRIPDTVTR